MTDAVTLQAIMRRYLGDYSETHRLDARRQAVCRHICQCRTATAMRSLW